MSYENRPRVNNNRRSPIFTNEVEYLETVARCHCGQPALQGGRTCKKHSGKRNSKSKGDRHSRNRDEYDW